MKNFESIFAAYVVGWAVFFVYYLTIARRLGQAEEQLRRLKESLTGRADRTNAGQL
jgi:CcmD family protein